MRLISLAAEFVSPLNEINSLKHQSNNFYIVNAAASGALLQRDFHFKFTKYRAADVGAALKWTLNVNEGESSAI